MQENQISQTPTVDSPQATVVQEVEQQPKKNNFLVILLSILLVISCLIAGFFAYQTQKLAKELQEIKSQKSVIPTPTPLVFSEPTTDPTVDWKTYSNKLFTFKYPSSWDTHMIGENANSTIMVAPKEKVDTVKQISGGFGGGTFLTLTISTKIEPPKWTSDEYWIVTSQEIIIDGLVGTKYDIDVIQDLPGLAKGDKTISIVIKKDTTYIQIDLLDKSYKTEFNQILSTFKFTN